MTQSKLFKDQFSTKEMREIFSDENLLQKWIDVEVALAKAEGELGIIPKEAAVEIDRKGTVDLFDMDVIKKGIDDTWHPLISFIREYKTLCDKDYGEYVHWGATTQDIMDTGMVMQIREGLEIVERDLITVVSALVDLAEKHADTVMPGRTHGQHALPITFGYKVSIWAAELHRHLNRLRQLKERVFTGNVAGAVGTLASLDQKGKEVQEKLMQYLNLNIPETPWHVSRDRLADVTSLLSMIGGTFGKISNEIIQLQKTEISELEEPFHFGKVGSSTMPQKRNPMACETVYSLSSLLVGQSSLGFQVMIQEHERDMGPWQAEWEFIPEMFLLTSGILKHMTWISEGLIVKKENMLSNLEKSNELIMSEAVMMRLAEKTGRQAAHDLIYKIAMDSHTNNTPLSVNLKKDEKVSGMLSDEEIDELINPTSYIGLSQNYVEEVTKHIRNTEGTPAPEVNVRN
ncbi:adenylosuccinate lyase [Halobacillus faecis]